MNEDGTMARVPQLAEFCRRYGIKMISVADLIRYRLQTETLVEQEAEGRIRTPYGEFEMIRYVSRLDGEAHLVLVHGDVKRKSNVLVRVHSRCVYGDVFGSLDCECERSIGAALKRIVQAGAESSSICIRRDRDCGLPGARAIENCWRMPAANLARVLRIIINLCSTRLVWGRRFSPILGSTTIRLLTNHPRKIVGVEAFGIQIVEQVHLRWKRRKMSV